MRSTLQKPNETKTEEKVTVALYARKSSKDDEEKSITAQLHGMREYSEKKGWIISDEFVDNAKTGTNDNRPAFQNLLNQTLRCQEENDIQKIVVWKLDRFCRNRNDSRLYKAMLEKKGVAIHTMMQEEVNNGGLSGNLLESIYEIMDEEYSRNLSQNIKRGFKQMLKRGHYPYSGKLIPYGYKIEKTINENNESIRGFVPIPEQAHYVKRIFEMRFNGIGSSTIAKKINAEGSKNKLGNDWETQSIIKVLANIRYVGHLPVRDELHKNFHPAIIEQEVFDQVQDMIKNKADKRNRANPQYNKSNFILTGVLKCGKCGAPMCGNTISTTRKSGKRYRHSAYTCLTYLRKGKSTCDQKRIKQDIIENQIVDALQERILTEENLKKIIDRTRSLKKQEGEKDIAEKKRISEEISILQEQLINLDEILLSRDRRLKMNPDSLEYLEKKHGEILRELKDRKAQMIKLKKTTNSIEEENLPEIIKNSISIKKLIQNSDKKDRKLFINSLINEIIINDTDDILVKYYLPSEKTLNIESDGEYIRLPRLKMIL